MKRTNRKKNNTTVSKDKKVHSIKLYNTFSGKRETSFFSEEEFQKIVGWAIEYLEKEYYEK